MRDLCAVLVALIMIFGFSVSAEALLSPRWSGGGRQR